MTLEALDIATGCPIWVDVEQPQVGLRQLSPAHLIDRDGDELVISAPEYVGGVANPRPGDVLIIKWTGNRGVQIGSATFLAVALGHRPTWRVCLDGVIERVQRREYARAAITGAVAIVPLGGGVTPVVKGELADLSEGGLRAHTHGGRLIAGSPVDVHLELDSTPVALAGRVLRSDPVAPDGSTHETVVTFELREAQAAAVRRVVLRQQMLARRERL